MVHQQKPYLDMMTAISACNLAVGPNYRALHFRNLFLKTLTSSQINQHTSCDRRMHLPFRPGETKVQTRISKASQLIVLRYTKLTKPKSRLLEGKSSTETPVPQLPNVCAENAFSNACREESTLTGASSRSACCMFRFAQADSTLVHLHDHT